MKLSWETGTFLRQPIYMTIGLPGSWSFSLTGPLKRDRDSECITSERENNELLKEFDTKEERGSLMGWRRVPDKLHSLIPFVCVNGCDCVTFAGSNLAPSFLLIMQGLITIQGDIYHQQRFNNKWGPCNFVNFNPQCRVGILAERK